MEIPEKYKFYDRDSTRTLKEGTLDVMYVPWNHFDIIEVWAVSPHPLKGVQLGYGFRRDFKEYGDKHVKSSQSISTDITKNVPSEGVKLTILSYNEAVKRAKEIDWSKVKIER